MQRAIRMVLALAMVPLVTGCIASTVANIAAAPVKAVGKAADLATTSQSESDAKRGRDLRRREERLGQLERDYRHAARRCDEGQVDECARRDAAYHEIQALLPTLPAQLR